MSAAANSQVTDPPVDAAPVFRLGQRDGAIVLAALSLWAAADAWHAATGLTFAVLLSTLDGIAVGAVVGRMAHEWATALDMWITRCREFPHIPTAQQQQPFPYKIRW